MRRHVDDYPNGTLVPAPYKRNVFLWRDERIDRYRLHRDVRYATDTIEHSPFEDRFYEVLPVAMELARGPFMLLSVEVRDNAMLRSPVFGGPENEYVFEFLQNNGIVYSVLIEGVYWIHVTKSGHAGWAEEMARIIEQKLLGSLQRERGERKVEG